MLEDFPRSFGVSKIDSYARIRLCRKLGLDICKDIRVSLSLSCSLPSPPKTKKKKKKKRSWEVDVQEGAMLQHVVVIESKS